MELIADVDIILDLPLLGIRAGPAMAVTTDKIELERDIASEISGTNRVGCYTTGIGFL